MTAEERSRVVTLDTNILQELWRNQHKSDIVASLLALSDAGRLDLAVTTRIDYDIPNEPLSERIDELPAIGVRTIGSPLRLGYSRLGSDDVLTDGTYSNIQEEIESMLRDRGLKVPETADFDHIFGHHIAARDVFLTWDKAILRAAEHFADALNVRIQTPEDFISDLGEQASASH